MNEGNFTPQEVTGDDESKEELRELRLKQMMGGEFTPEELELFLRLTGEKSDDKLSPEERKEWNQLTIEHTNIGFNEFPPEKLDRYLYLEEKLKQK